MGEYYEVNGTDITKYYGGQTAMRKNGVVTYLLSDHLGSNSLVVDSSGNMLSETRYKAWGELRYSTGTTTTPYTYTGQYSNTADFGWMYYKARWYDNELGRFAQPDTIIPKVGNPQSWDRYSYVKNNPILYNDPTGHCELTCVLAIIMSGGAIVGAGINIYQQYQENQSVNIDEVVDAAWLGAITAGGIFLAPFLAAEGTTLLISTIPVNNNLNNKISETTNISKSILDSVSKSSARDALRAGLEGLTKSQAQKALDIMGNGKMESVSINSLTNGNAQVMYNSLGGDGGSFVKYIYTIDPSGKTIDLIQKGYNASGELVHIHDKINNFIK